MILVVTFMYYIRMSVSDSFSSNVFKVRNITKQKERQLRLCEKVGKDCHNTEEDDSELQAELTTTNLGKSM